MSEHEVAARQAKAEKMARVLARHGSDSDTAANLPPKGQRMVARLAGTRPASPTTWQVVVDTLRGYESIAVAVA